jgi:hypothetical protein
MTRVMKGWLPLPFVLAALSSAQASNRQSGTDECRTPGWSAVVREDLIGRGRTRWLGIRNESGCRRAVCITTIAIEGRTRRGAVFYPPQDSGESADAPAVPECGTGMWNLLAPHATHFFLVRLESAPPARSAEDLVIIGGQEMCVDSPACRPDAFSAQATSPAEAPGVRSPAGAEGRRQSEWSGTAQQSALGESADSYWIGLVNEGVSAKTVCITGVTATVRKGNREEPRSVAAGMVQPRNSPHSPPCDESLWRLVLPGETFFSSVEVAKGDGQVVGFVLSADEIWMDDVSPKYTRLAVRAPLTSRKSAGGTAKAPAH